MRSICKKSPAILVAVLALCALASASASAAEWNVAGKALVGSAAFAGTAKVEEKITFTMPTEGTKHVKLVCTSLYPGKSQIKAPNTATLSKVELGGCTITEGAECSVEGEELFTKTTLSMELSKGTGTADTVVLKPEVGTTLFGYAYLLGGKCPLPNPWSLGFTEGHLNLTMASGQTEAAEQPFTFPGEKEHLEWAGKPIYLSGKFKLKLASGGLWSFR